MNYSFSHNQDRMSELQKENQTDSEEEHVCTNRYIIIIIIIIINSALIMIFTKFIY